MRRVQHLETLELRQRRRRNEAMHMCKYDTSSVPDKFWQLCHEPLQNIQACRLVPADKSIWPQERSLGSVVEQKKPRISQHNFVLGRDGMRSEAYEYARKQDRDAVRRSTGSERAPLLVPLRRARLFGIEVAAKSFSYLDHRRRRSECLSQ